MKVFKGRPTLLVGTILLVVLGLLALASLMVLLAQVFWR